MKRNYNSLEFSLVLASTASSLLVGSVTSVPIGINEVTVEDYHQGFGTTPGVDDFQNISFD